MSGYVIVGDTEQYNDCLVCVCRTTLDEAKLTLERMRLNPTETDMALIKGHRNLRLKEVPEVDCWWNYGCD